MTAAIGIRWAMCRIRFVLGMAALGIPAFAAAQPEGLRPPTDDCDTVAWNNYFSAWEAVAPADAQLWIDRFNYDFNRSRREEFVLRGAQDSLRAAGESSERLILTDSAGNEAGSLGRRIAFDEKLLARAIAAIDHGIALHPDRLDMYLGRAAAFAYAERYGRMTDALCALVARAETNGGRWLAPDGRTVEYVEPKQLIAGYLQDYVNRLFEAASSSDGDAAGESLGRLARCEAEYCPESVVALNNLGAWHYGAGRIDEALDCFVRASAVDPSDGTMLYNIGYLYLRRGDKESAHTWWRRLLDSPDVDERRRAEELLREVDGKTAVQ